MAPLLAVDDRIVDYLPVLILFLFAIGFAGLNLVVSWLAGSKGKHNPVKDAAYECGLPPITDAHQRFSVKFYLVALLFVLFDIEVVFLYPWATSFANLEVGHQLAGMYLGRVLFFMATTVIAYIYGWRKGVFRFD